MVILNRFVNQFGKVVAYYFKDANLDIEDITNAENAFRYPELVTNASFTGDDFVAEHGSEITTINIGDANVIHFKGIEHTIITNVFRKYYGGDFIDVCFKIRNAIKSGNFVISNDFPDGGKRLLSFGIDVICFAKGFLEVLQPFCLQCIEGAFVAYTERFFKFVLKFAANDRLIVSVQYNDCNDLHVYEVIPCVVIPDEFCNGNKFVIMVLQRLFLRQKIKVYSQLSRDGVAVVTFYDILRQNKKLLGDVVPLSESDEHRMCTSMYVSPTGEVSLTPVYSLFGRLSMMVDNYALDGTNAYRYFELAYNELLLFFPEGHSKLYDDLVLKYGLHYNVVFDFICFLLDLSMR